ncbi:HAMP domain-containing histidine kinase [Ideonella azotifigens]|uniref:histidine kinase n=1 Tax=Ideonella azotifigens TaxID=513160 RepID=A0ABN1KGB5_9BURK|nr:HAMP domain-containing sensor histidine kinase [Ideonella azotifigens]MCD2340413.1 HAMP domain-containing histidine kinase [Ideonella azotifigens]
MNAIPSPDDEPSSLTPPATDAVAPVATDELVAAWQARLQASTGEARARLLVTLAWHLRQRDPAQARRMAGEALSLVSIASSEAPSLLGRLQLVFGEQALFAAAFEPARTHALAARDLFASAGDMAGTADMHGLLASLEADLGHHDKRDAALNQARAAALAAADPLRLAIIDAAMAYNAAVADNGHAASDWAAAIDPQLTSRRSVVLVACTNDLRAVMAFQRGEYGLAITWLRDQLEAARVCGMVRKQITTAANLSMAFSMFNDHGTALEWAQEALGMAKACGWPVLVGTALLQTAQVLDTLDKRSTAQAMLDESLAVLKQLPGAYLHLEALSFQGRLALARGDAMAALQWSDELERLSQKHYRENFLFAVCLGRARAFMLMGRAPEAEQGALAALESAQAMQWPHAQIDALELLAGLHDRFELSPPVPLAATTAPLHYLGQALAVAVAMPDFRVPYRLFEQLAEQHAKVGEHASAYARSLDAAAAREATHSREVRHLAMAAQLRHEAESARAERDHQRRIADIEAERARSLQQALSELSAAQDELMQRNAEQARLHAEREETLAFLAHDLRAPLVALGPALQSVTPKSAAQRAERLAERALAMTDRFLAVARLSRLPIADRVPLDLASLVDAACETFERRAIDEGRRLELDLVFGIAIVGHRETLMRAFCNLVDNALKFSRDGGRVDVSVVFSEHQAAMVVTDDGPGMPAAAQQVLLRTGGERSVFSGGRLGLAIVAEVAKVHEARVAVDTGPHGTRIAFWLPRVAA